MSARYLILLFAALLAGLAACKNNDNVFPAKTTSLLTVVNAGNDTLNLYLNGTRQNNTSSLSAGGSLVYVTVPSGAQNYQFKKLGSQSVLFSAPLTLPKNVYNSFYITGETADKTFHTLDTLLIDTLSNKAAIRFVHTSAAIGNLDILVGDSVSFKAIPFKTSAPFQIFTVGAREVKVYQSGTSAPLVDTLITFSANRVYTLFSRGAVGGTGNAAFNVGVILNY